MESQILRRVETERLAVRRPEAKSRIGIVEPDKVIGFRISLKLAGGCQICEETNDKNLALEAHAILHCHP